MKAISTKKVITICSVLIIISQLAVFPSALSDNRKHFTSIFGGYVTTLEGPFPVGDKFARFHLITTGGAQGDIPGTVIINEEILININTGIGIGPGRFTVTVGPAGDIYVVFVARITSFLNFKGQFLIVGGTGYFKGIRGYGELSGQASGTGIKGYVIGAIVTGTVEGYYTLPSH